MSILRIDSSRKIQRLAALSIVKFTQQKYWRLLFVGFVVLGALFLIMMPALYGKYQIPVIATQGYELQWATEPGTQFGSAYKQAQHKLEVECDYHLSGWASETTLAYTSECLPGIWQHNFSDSQNEWSLFEGEASALDASSIHRWDNSSYLSQPAALQEASQFPFLTLERSVSPTGEWEAIVVRWFYGPSDVVLVGKN